MARKFMRGCDEVDDENYNYHHNPGTPDEDISQERLRGRQAYRRGLPCSQNPYPSGAARMDWYAGWYDVRLKRFYDDPKKAL